MVNGGLRAAKVATTLSALMSIFSEVGVKASGGIKTLVDVKQMIDAGADRVGTSSAVEIVS